MNNLEPSRTMVVENELIALLRELTENNIQHCQDIMQQGEEIENIKELLEKRIYLSSVERIQIQKHVKGKVKLIINEGNYNYKKCSKCLFKEIYSVINNQYCVTSYTELPSKYFVEIVEAIDKYIMSPQMKKKLNEAMAS